jgi:hypothetical protein
MPHHTDHPFEGRIVAPNTVAHIPGDTIALEAANLPLNRGVWAIPRSGTLHIPALPAFVGIPHMGGFNHYLVLTTHPRHMTGGDDHLDTILAAEPLPLVYHPFPNMATLKLTWRPKSPTTLRSLRCLITRANQQWLPHSDCASLAHYLIPRLVPCSLRVFEPHLPTHLQIWIHIGART